MRKDAQGTREFSQPALLRTDNLNTNRHFGQIEQARPLQSSKLDYYLQRGKGL